MFKILLVVCLIAVSVNAKPQLSALKETLSSGIGSVTGVFDGCKGKDHSLNADKNACAILYDHSNCRDEKVVVPIGYTKLSFRDRNDVESVLVKKGCTLTLFGDSGDDINKRGQSYIVSAAGKTEAVGKTLDDSKELEADAESVECKC